MARRLFGTDGVRGSAGTFLTAELALALGREATVRAAAERPQVLIIRDTRESGEMLQAAVAAGVSAAGGDALIAGILPTPAAPLLIGRYGFDLGVVISASHNPFADNGIKFFGADGYKLSDATEAAIEESIAASASAPAASRPAPRAGRSAGSASCGGPLRTTCASCTPVSPISRSRASTCCSTAPTAPPSRSPPRSSGASARR